MKIALINENSQAAKNEIIFEKLSAAAKKYGHEVINYGMFGSEDKHSLTYVQAGLLTAILLNSGAADFVVTGCGTGEGACLACNSFPNVLCGHIVDASDAFMFREINDGNAISLPYAKGFGWGGELVLEQIFENLLKTNGGNGYPKERVVPEQANKKILDNVKKVTHQDMVYILKHIDQKFLKDTVDYPFFRENFFKDCTDKKIASEIKKLLK